MKIFSTEAAVN